VSEWTVDTLKEYVLSLLFERDKAITKLEVETKASFAARNELQQTMKTQGEAAAQVVASLSGTYISRAEFDNRLNRTDQDVRSVTDRVNRGEGRGLAVKDYWGYIFGIIGLLIAAAMYFKK
jgi:hypothetical protein